MYLKPIRDFLVYIEDCHRALADLYQRLSIEVTDHKVKLLLEYMKNKEHIFYIKLQHFVQQAPLSLLNTWLTNNIPQDFPLHCKNVELRPELAIKDVVALAVQLDMQLIELMQTAAFDSPTVEAEIALENLTNREEEMLQQVVIASHEFEHM